MARDNGPHDLYRCRACSVALWSDYGRRPQIRFLRAGTLDEPRALRPDIHIYTATKAPWLRLPKGTPAFKAYYDAKKVWSAANLKRLKAALAKPR